MIEIILGEILAMLFFALLIKNAADEVNEYYDRRGKK